MDDNKQKISELLRKKEYWEKKKNWYFLQYHDWVDNGWLQIFALLGVSNMAGSWIKESISWMKTVL